MYGQPTRRSGGAGGRGVGGGAGDGGNSNGAGANGHAPAADDYAPYAPAKQPAAPSAPAFYQPPPAQNFYGGGGGGGYSGSPPRAAQQTGFLPVSPTLSSASGGGPAAPPAMPSMNGYAPQQQPDPQYQHPFQQQQFQQQQQYQPQPPQQQQALHPQQQPLQYAGSNGFMQPQYMQQQQPQQQQQQMFQPQQQQQYQYAPMEPAASQQPAQDPFQTAQGMAMQFGAAQMISGLAQQLGAGGGGAGAGAAAAAAVGPQIMQNLGVHGYFSSGASGAVGDGTTFMRVPKHYFAVNHAYVLRKLALLIMPFQRRSWSRRAGVDQRQFERQGSEDATAYLPPRDDVNAPDLYIPVMAFVSYVLLVGFVFGTRGTFTAEVLAKYFSKGFGVLTLEVLVIKLGLYLIAARPTPWLDVIAYRGYKFVGVIIAMVCDLIFPRMYYFVFFYTAFAMAIFLMRSHRRIILPQGSERQSPGDLPQRNAFLLFVCALQFPIYWLLILDVR